MTAQTVAPAWPEPYLQPDRTLDCGYYSQAYLCRALGHREVTADQVKAWRAETRIHETRYAPNVLGATILTHWDVYEDGQRTPRDVTSGSRREHKLFWLGQSGLAREWVRVMLSEGWIAQAMVHRIQPMGHAVVLLDANDDGVLLMDPIYGHVTEPWSWFLGPGPKSEAAEWPGRAEDSREWYGCTFIEGWYRR